MFKSPTCTKRDTALAERMARIANVSLETLGKELFSGSSDTKPVSELIRSDFKGVPPLRTDTRRRSDHDS